MAFKAGRSPGFISKLERGEAGASGETLSRVAAALGVPEAAINREELP